MNLKPCRFIVNGVSEPLTYDQMREYLASKDPDIIEARANLAVRQSKTEVQQEPTLGDALKTKSSIVKALDAFLNPPYMETVMERMSAFDERIEDNEYPTLLDFAQNVLPPAIFDKYKPLYEMAARNMLTVSYEKLYGMLGMWDGSQIVLDKKTAKFDIEDYNRLAEVMNHEAIHGLIQYGVSNDYNLYKNLESVMDQVVSNYDSANDEVKGIISSIQDGRSSFSAKDFHGATSEEKQSENFREVGSLEELLTYAFTNKEFSKFLDKIPASKKIEAKSSTIFGQLKDLIRTSIAKMFKNGSALDEINSIVDQYFDSSYREADIANRNEKYWNYDLVAKSTPFGKLNNDPKAIADAYQQAKESGTEPELVHAVEKAVFSQNNANVRSSKAQGSTNTYYNPAMAADKGDKFDKARQVDIYDLAKSVWDKTPGDDYLRIHEAILALEIEQGVSLGAADQALLFSHVATGKRPVFKENGKLNDANQDDHSLISRFIKGLGALGTDRRVNRHIINGLKANLSYTVENQEAAMDVADVAIQIFGGISSLTTANQLLDFSNQFTGAVRTFLQGKVISEATRLAKEAKAGSEEQKKLEKLATQAAFMLAERVRENGRENAALYKLYLTTPEGIFAVEQARARRETEEQAKRGPKKDRVERAAAEMNTAQNQAATEAASSPEVEAAIDAVTGNTSSGKGKNPKPPKPPKPPKQQQPPKTKAEELRRRQKSALEGLKARLRDLGILRSSTTSNAGLDQEVLDYVIELGRITLERGTHDRVGVTQALFDLLTAEGITVNAAYVDAAWSEISAEAWDFHIQSNAEAVARGVVAAVESTGALGDLDPVKLLINNLIRKASEGTKAKPDKRSMMEKVQSLFENWMEARDTWEPAKLETARMIEGLNISRAQKDEMQLRLENFFNERFFTQQRGKATWSLPFSEKTAESVLTEAMREQGFKIKDVLLSSSKIIADTREQFVDALVAEMTANCPFMSLAQVKDIVEKFTKVYDAKVEKKQTELIKRFLPKKKTIEKISRNNANAKRAFEMMKYGFADPHASLTDPVTGEITPLNQFFCDMFGIPYLTPEMSADLKIFADEIAKTPVDSVYRQNAYNDMMSYVQYYRMQQTIAGDFVMAQVYANLLFSADTMIKAFNSNILAWPLEYLTQTATNTATGRAPINALIRKGFFGAKGVKGTDGYTRLGKDAAIMSLYGLVENNMFNSTSTAEVMSRHGKSAAAKKWGKYARTPGRLLGAMDVLMTAGATQARISDLLYDELLFQAKSHGVKVDKKTLAAQVAEIQGYTMDPQLDAIEKARAEFEQSYGRPVDLNSKKEAALFRTRVFEIARNTMSDRAQAFVAQNQWAAGLDRQRILEIIDESVSVAGKIGMVGTPPGSGGAIAMLVKSFGKNFRFSNLVLGTFVNAPINSALFMIQGNTSLSFLLTAARLMKNERGLFFGSDAFRKYYEQEGIRTKMYGRTTGVISLGNAEININKEKKEMLARLLMIQIPMIAGTMMTSTFMLQAMASAFRGDDDDEIADRITKEGFDALVDIPVRQRILKFFGNKTSEPGSVAYTGTWKQLGCYVTGSVFGYTGKGYAKTMEMKATYGIEPYCVYAYGRKLFSYKDNPVLAAYFGQMGATLDTQLFCDDLGVMTSDNIGLTMYSSAAQLNLVRDQAAIRPVSEVFEAIAGQRSYENYEGMGDRTQMYIAKTLGGLVNSFLMPAEIKNTNQDIHSLYGDALNDPKSFIEYAFNRIPVLEDIVMQNRKVDHFNRPVEVSTKRVLPVPFQGVVYTRMEDGQVKFPQVDQIMASGSKKYYSLFSEHLNDKFREPGVSSYFDAEGYQHKFNREQREDASRIYAKMMGEFCDKHYDELKDSDDITFGVMLDVFLFTYKGYEDKGGHTQYIIDQVVKDKGPVFTTESIDQSIEEIEEAIRPKK